MIKRARKWMDAHPLYTCAGVLAFAMLLAYVLAFAINCPREVVDESELPAILRATGFMLLGRRA